MDKLNSTLNSNFWFFQFTSQTVFINERVDSLSRLFPAFLCFEYRLRQTEYKQPKPYVCRLTYIIKLPTPYLYIFPVYEVGFKSRTQIRMWEYGSKDADLYPEDNSIPRVSIQYHHLRS
jgi:hypothetical protein